jgi:pimeloyl-ACP methyl ester carboxylesterase
MKRILAFITLFGIFSGVYSQTTKQTWSGYIKPTAKDSIKFILTLHFENDTLKEVTSDSPEQTVFNVKASKFSLQNDTLQVSFMNQGASYKGIVLSDELISGIFTQGGKKIPLELQPSMPILPPNRPQTPQPPYPYLEEEIEMNDHNGDLNIKGTLTIPKDGKIKATFILITGSGWHDRDETIFLHKPFMVIADYFTRNGCAVYRYDDLPVNVFLKSTTLDFEKNVQMIVKHFQNDERTKNQPVGLLGHSEGGLISFMAAGNNPSIDFIVSLAGPGEKFNDVLLYQIEKSSRGAGFNDKEIEDILEIQGKFNQLIMNAKNTKDAKIKLEKLVAEYMNKWNDEQKKRYNLTPAKVLEMNQLINYLWYPALFKIEPAKYIKKIKCPVYAMVGEKDMQIYYKTNVAIIEHNLSKKTPRKIVAFPNVNHILQTCETGLFDEYKEIEETVSPKLLEDVLLWVNEINGRQR